MCGCCTLPYVKLCLRCAQRCAHAQSVLEHKITFLSKKSMVPDALVRRVFLGSTPLLGFLRPACNFSAAKECERKHVHMHVASAFSRVRRLPSPYCNEIPCFHRERVHRFRCCSHRIERNNTTPRDLRAEQSSAAPSACCRPLYIDMCGACAFRCFSIYLQHGG